MIPPSEYVETHGRADVALLFELWAEGLSSGKIAKRFGVCVSTVTKWAQRYKLPSRVRGGTPEMPAPSVEDEVASLAGLALSPWVEARARERREAHYALRRAEPEILAAAKARAWRRGDYEPKGAHHEKF